MNVTIMITSRNRLDELRRTLELVRRLRPAPLEILVTADGCTDCTVEVIRTENPYVTLIVNETSRGSVASRAAMMQRARSELVLALDDDSYPLEQDCLARLADYFESRPRLAVATFPQRSDEYPDSLEQVDFGPERVVSSFPNSGACLRVSTYRQLPGFESLFFHMYEEPDYALQCIGHGWEVRFWPTITIRHHWTPNQRSEMRNHHRHARNELWSALMRCPLPYLLAVAPYRILSQLRYAAKRGPSWVIREPIWWWDMLKELRHVFSRREPVSWGRYWHWLRLPNGTIKGL